MQGLLDGTALAMALRDEVIAAGRGEASRFAEFLSGDRTFLFALTPVTGAAYVNLYGRNVSEERRAQRQVLAEKAFTENLLDNLSNGVVTFDTDLRVTMANPAAHTLLRHDDEIVGRNAWELWPRNDAIVSTVMAKQFLYRIW